MKEIINSYKEFILLLNQIQLALKENNFEDFYFYNDLLKEILSSTIQKKSCIKKKIIIRYKTLLDNYNQKINDNQIFLSKVKSLPGSLYLSRNLQNIL